MRVNILETGGVAANYCRRADVTKSAKAGTLHVLLPMIVPVVLAAGELYTPYR